MQRLSTEELFLKMINASSETILHVILSSDKYLKQLNGYYRKKEYTTDVLTFLFDNSNYDMHNELQASHNMDQSIPLAEIYISVDTAENQAKEHDVSLANELSLLTIHGILHSIGLDHERSQYECLVMKEKERDLLDSIGLSFIPPLTH